MLGTIFLSDVMLPARVKILLVMDELLNEPTRQMGREPLHEVAVSCLIATEHMEMQKDPEETQIKYSI